MVCAILGEKTLEFAKVAFRNEENGLADVANSIPCHIARIAVNAVFERAYLTENDRYRRIVAALSRLSRSHVTRNPTARPPRFAFRTRPMVVFLIFPRPFRE